jgi:hypothetical protein
VSRQWENAVGPGTRHRQGLLASLRTEWAEAEEVDETFQKIP